MQRFNDREFVHVGSPMTMWWDESLEEPEVWLRFSGEMSLRNIVIRQFLDEMGMQNLILEEHLDYADAFWANRKNDGSIKPLRAVHFRKLDDTWSELECNCKSL